MNIIDIDMSMRLYNELNFYKINNIEDLSNITQDEVIYKWRNLGRRCLNELINIMNEYNVKFKGE